MKNIFRIITILALVPFMTGCFDDPGSDTMFSSEESFVEIADASQVGAERRVFSVVIDGNSIAESLTVSIAGAAPSSDVTVGFEVVDAESSAVEGTDFTLVSTGSVTIPAGEFTTSIEFLVNDDILDPEADPKTITFRLTSTSEGVVSEIYDEFTVEIVGICPPELYDYATIPGTYTASTDGNSTDTCPDPTTYEGLEVSLTITNVSGSVEDGSFVYTINDSFGGLYQNWYGACYGYTFATTNEFTLDVATGNLTGAWSSAFGGDNFDMTGTFDFCSGVMVITWTNAFGDTGETTIATM